MKFLLDTHVLLWLVGQPERVPDQVKRELSDPAYDLLVSSVSAMEVATKTRLGKLPDFGLVGAWERRVADLGGAELPLSAADATMAGSMSWGHRDPFDRMLAAQAIQEGAVLVTVDRAFAGLAAPHILSW